MRTADIRAQAVSVFTQARGGGGWGARAPACSPPSAMGLCSDAQARLLPFLSALLPLPD